MQFVLGGLIWFARWIAVGLVARVLTTIGFSVVTYYGIGALFSQAHDAVFSNMGGTSASILAILAMARIDDAMKVILSAYAAVLVLRGVTAAGAMAVGYWASQSE